MRGVLAFFLGLALCVGAASPALAVIAHVQSATGQGSSSTTATATGSAVGSGNVVVGNVRWTNAVTLSSVTDDKGNTYTVLDTVTLTGTEHSASFVLGNITNAPTALTATFSGSAFAQVAWDEYSGAATVSNPTDGHVSNVQASLASGTDNITSTSITTTVNGDMIWGATADQSGPAGTLSAGTGYASRASQYNFYHQLSEDKIQSSAGSVAATFSATMTDTWATLVVAIKPPVAASGAPMRSILGVGK